MEIPTASGVRSIDLSPETVSASKARTFVRDTLSEWGYDAVEPDVSLAVSELVTNAVVHAHSPTCVTLLDLRDGVQLRVRDDTPEPPTMLEPREADTGGRGMFLVDSVADNWGVEAAPPGKVVWLDITNR